MNRGGLVEGAFLPDPAMEGKRHDVASGTKWNRYWSSFKEVKEDEKGLSPAHCMGKSAKLWIVHQKCGEYHNK